ncbi:MAG: flagellar biosynthesis protein FlhB [Pseudomonadota bacterium]
MAEDSDLERTEDPSERRLEQAREEGQVARSRELSTFAVTFAGGAALWVMGGSLSSSMQALIHEGLTLNHDTAFNADLLIPRLFHLSMQALLAFMPVLMLTFAAAALSPLLLNGWLFTMKPLQPDLSRINPISGVGRMFSMHSLMELAKALAKSVIIGGIGAWVIWGKRDDVLMLISQPLPQAISHLGTLMWTCFAFIMGGMLLIVAIDVPFQLWDHHRKLKMTKEELRQEAKESEGDPHVKGRIRSMQREMARRRMMAAIPTADVVVTNPTHYAVALKYSENGMRAPIVVAKGTHILAARIREIATENNVPILEAPPLARALYKHVDLEHPIPETLYTAVAEVLAYVFQLRRYQEAGGIRPREPRDLPVPKELDPAASQPHEIAAAA